MPKDIKCIVLLSDQARKEMFHNISDLTVFGVNVISNIRDIDSVLLNRTNRLIIIGSYDCESLEDILLYKDILGLECFYIGKDYLVIDSLKDTCKCYRLDYSEITDLMIYNVLYSEDNMKDNYVYDSDFIKEVENAKKIMANSLDNPTLNLCNDFLRIRGLLDFSNKQREQYMKELLEIKGELNVCTKQKADISRSFNELVERVIQNQRSMADFEMILSKDIYTKLNLSTYDSPPRILYIKQYQELMYVESMLDVLYNAFKLQGNMSTKILRLHDSGDIHNIKLKRPKYHLIREQFIESEVVNADFILSVGSYLSLLDLLLQNKHHLDLLIIIDCKYYNDTVINGNMVYLNTVRNVKDTNLLGIDPTNTITNDKNHLLSWTHSSLYYDDEVNEEQRFIKLSSRPLIQKLLRLVEV